MSTLIYFFHGIAIIAARQLFPNMNAFPIWCMIILCCVIISALLLRLSRTKGMLWMANFY